MTAQSNITQVGTTPYLLPPLMGFRPADFTSWASILLAHFLLLFLFICFTGSPSSNIYTPGFTAVSQRMNLFVERTLLHVRITLSSFSTLLVSISIIQMSYS
jgi:hypothetical protein